MIKYIVWDVGDGVVERGECKLDEAFMRRMRGWVQHGYEVWIRSAEDAS